MLPLKLGVDRLSWHEGKKRACGCVEGHYTYIELTTTTWHRRAARARAVGRSASALLMVAIAARAPAFFRTVYHAISGGGKRKRDDSTHTAPQPSSGMSPPLRMGLNLFNKRPRTQGCLDDEVWPFALPSLLSPTPALHLLATAGQEREIALNRQRQDLPGMRGRHPRKPLNAAPKFPPSSSPPFSPPNSSGNPWATTPAARPSPMPATPPTRDSSGGPAASPPLRPPQLWGSASARVATTAAGPSALAAAPAPAPSDDDIRHGDPGTFEEQVERMRRLTGKIALQEKGLDTLKGREQAARDAQARTVTQRMAQSAARRLRIEAALKVRPAAMRGRGRGGGATEGGWGWASCLGPAAPAPRCEHAAWRRLASLSGGV